MIEFSSSLKLNEIQVVDGPFNEDPKNIVFFFKEALILGEGQSENWGKMGNNRDIHCYANRGVVNVERECQPPPPGTHENPCDASIFLHARPIFREKMKKLNFQAKICPFFRVLPPKI